MVIDLSKMDKRCIFCPRGKDKNLIILTTYLCSECEYLNPCLPCSCCDSLDTIVFTSYLCKNCKMYLPRSRATQENQY